MIYFSSSPTSHMKSASIGIGLIALFAVVGATAQVSSVGSSGIDNSGNYQQERAWCMANTTGEAQATCLKGASAAQAEKRRGTLDTNAADYAANAMRRCDILKGEDRAACQARVAGYGSASGSVIGGGVIKEVETVVLPPGQSSVTIVPKTANPVLLVPAK